MHSSVRLLILSGGFYITEREEEAGKACYSHAFGPSLEQVEGAKAPSHFTE